MSMNPGDTDEGDGGDTGRLLARAAATLGGAETGLRQTIDDFFIDERARLDDRTRATLAATLAAIVASVESDVRRRAALALPQSGATSPVFGRLAAAGLLRDPDLMRELIDRTRFDLMAETLVVAAPDDRGAASLLTRLAASADTTVATAARALMAATGRRRAAISTGALEQIELPANLHHRLVWSVAAAIHEQFPGDEEARVLADAAIRAIGGYDENDRAETAAMRLAAAIDARPGELPMLLNHALDDRNVALFAAFLAFALGVDFPAARRLVLGGGDPLWLALRANGLDRTAIARIGVALGGDVGALADQLDAIVAVDPAEARAVLAPLSLPADFRAAIAALAAAP